MTPTTIHEAKTHLSRLIRPALAGEEVVIGKRNKALVKRVPIEAIKPAERRFGGWEDETWMGDDVRLAQRHETQSARSTTTLLI